MINYRSFILCLSVFIVVVTSENVRQSRYYVVDIPSEYYNYQIIPDAEEKVKVEVFYECLCPDCTKFHTGPLISTILKIGSYLDLKSYPYGNALKSMVDGKSVIRCQHGPAECYGNKLHACAIDVIKNETQADIYNTCMMTSKWGGKGSTDLDATNCGKEMGIDGAAIIACAQSKRGQELLEYYGKITDKYYDQTSVPFVLINGKKFTGENDQFMGEVCAAFENPPPQCQQLIDDGQEKVKIEVFYECLCPYCRIFHTGPIMDVVMKIGSYLDMKSYPYGNAKKTVVDGKTVIVCQHGPAECYGNKLHACAIDLINNDTRAEFYNSCMMAAKWGGRGSTDTDAANCGKSMGIDGATVTACAQSQRGEDLLEYYGKINDMKHPEPGVPYILINDKVFDGENDQFMAAVCAAFEIPPPQCNEIHK